MAVTLFQIVEGAPLVFHCERMSANISPKTCASNYQTCHFASCEGCLIGREHAQGAPSISMFSAPRPCRRCETVATRRVAGLCLSCLNRHYEIERGRNAKGSPPLMAAQRLHRCSALVAGEVAVLDLVAGCTTPRSACAPQFFRISGGGFVTGLFTGRDELERWLRESHPRVNVIDFELGPTVAQEQDYQHPTNRGRDSNING